jgi:hypothetical protein
MTATTAFGRALRDKQHAVWKDSKGNRWRKGIKLRTRACSARLCRQRRAAAPRALPRLRSRWVFQAGAALDLNPPSDDDDGDFRP